MNAGPVTCPVCHCPLLFAHPEPDMRLRVEHVEATVHRAWYTLTAEAVAS